MRPRNNFRIIILFLLSCIVSSCDNFKQSNFNRQKYLDLSFARVDSKSGCDSLTFQTTKDLLVVEKSFLKNNLEQGFINFPLHNNFSTEQCNAKSEIFESELNPSANIEFNDTLFYKSGLIKQVEIISFDEYSISYFYVLHGKTKENSVRSTTINCFVIYDSLYNFEHAHGDCYIPSEVLVDSTSHFSDIGKNNDNQNDLSQSEGVGLVVIFFGFLLTGFIVIIVYRLVYG